MYTEGSWGIKAPPPRAMQPGVLFWRVFEGQRRNGQARGPGVGGL